MVLPLLLGMGLPALAGSGALAGLGAFGTTLSGLSAPVLAGLGTGLGSFIQTGDLGKGIQTGLTSFVGGKVLGGLTNSTAPAALESSTSTPMGGFLQASPPISEVVKNPSPLFGKMFGNPAATSELGKAFTAGSAAFAPAYMGQAMTDAQMMEEEAKRAAKKRDDEESTVPPLNPMRRTQNANPFMSGGGEGLYFQYQRQPRPDGSEIEAPYYYNDGGIMSISRMQEGGEAEADEMMAESGMNEKDVIVDAIEAIKGMSEQPEIVLALFVQKYGEDALRDLVGRVQSGELDDTVDRFESGDKGMVRGPGDGSGVDDMVPAKLEGEQDVLLSDGEFVLREKTTDALEKAYGGGFLDMVNRAEEDAPKKLQQMVG